MTRAQHLGWKTALLLSFTTLIASLIGCDGTAGEAAQPLAQLVANRLQHLQEFSVGFGRQMLAAWLF